MGNLALRGERANGNWPRSPLVIAEVQEEPFALKKETIFAIDERGFNDSLGVQMSNFRFYQDRETGDLVIFLTRYGEQSEKEWMLANYYRYRIQMPPTSQNPAPKAPDKKLPLAGELFSVQGRPAFVILPRNPLPGKRIPWVWYAPTLPPYPGEEERWMFEQFLAAGIAIAGIDVGESYGSPDGRKLYTALYEELTKRRGFSKKPVLLGRSRGGLMTLCWAEDNPGKVGGFAGIYPVCSIVSYPGLKNAASAYHLTESELSKHLKEHNPVDRLAPLARANVPLFAIHGDSDKVVPLEENSGLMKQRYERLGDKMQLNIPPGQGHNMWSGFFKCQELIVFVLKNARP